MTKQIAKAPGPLVSSAYCVRGALLSKKKKKKKAISRQILSTLTQNSVRWEKTLSTLQTTFLNIVRIIYLFIFFSLLFFFSLTLGPLPGDISKHRFRYSYVLRPNVLQAPGGSSHKSWLGIPETFITFFCDFFQKHGTICERKI